MDKKGCAARGGLRAFDAERSSTLIRTRSLPEGLRSWVYPRGARVCDWEAQRVLEPVLLPACPSVRSEVDVDQAVRTGDGTGVRAGEPFPVSGFERLMLLRTTTAPSFAFLTGCRRTRGVLREVGK